MANRILLGSVTILLLWAGTGRTQPMLGIPVSVEDAHNGPCCAAKPPHPMLAHFTRTLAAPFRAVSNCLNPPPPPAEQLPTRDDVARMVSDGSYSQAEVSAAKIRIDEAQGYSRSLAVRYLGTIDCNYYPEVEMGLVGALRADRVEAVRYEAAIALGSGRGLTMKMLEALNMTALGVELDGNPAESSEKVRLAARMALHKCASRGLCLPPPGPMFPISPAPQEYMLPPPRQGQPRQGQPPTQQERMTAETISTSAKTATPRTTPNSLYQVLVHFRSSRDQSQPGVDPRLSGLTQIGDPRLAIPLQP